MSPLSIARLSICAAAMALLAVASAASGARLRSIDREPALRRGHQQRDRRQDPGGSLVDATNCAEGWCEVEWQGKKGFAIETAIDRSGRVGGRPVGARRLPVAAADRSAIGPRSCCRRR